MKKYMKPYIGIVTFNGRHGLMQDVIVASGDTSGKVNPDDPINPGDPIYSNHSSIWGEEE